MSVEPPEKAILPLDKVYAPDVNSIICRLCANPNDKIIGIFSEEGLSNELSHKMNLYLPIKVSENDSLPLQCCWNCASTVLAWHELVVVSVEADRRLRGLLEVQEVKPSGMEMYRSFQEEEVESPLQEVDRSIETQSSHETLETNISYMCHTCNEQFSLRKDILQHINQQHKPKTKRRQRSDIEYNLFCDICNVGFTRKYDLRKHRINRHPAASPDQQTQNVFAVKDTESGTTNVCLICEAEFVQLTELKRHLHIHSVKVRRTKSEITDKHFCTVCDKGFTRKYDMQKHQKLKHSLVNRDCNTDIKKAELLKRCKITDDGGVYYKCDVCNKAFKSCKNLKRHYMIHTGSRPYFCHICGKDFRVSGGLNRHINEHHHGIKKYDCETCGRWFAAKATRDEHRNIHTNNRPFVCSTCGKAYRQKASLHNHALFHAENYRFSCNICDKKYRRASELKVHSWLHTGEKPYKCEVCPGKFRLRQDLNRHLKVHNKEYDCTGCGRKFSQNRHLINHRKNCCLANF